MQFGVRTVWQVIVYSVLLTGFVVAVPAFVLNIMLGWFPHFIRFGAIVVSSTLMTCLAFPLSVLALNSVRRVNATISTLDHLIKFDPMTGLLARNHFFHLVEGVRKDGGYIAILDADRFKLINDTHGHEAGDLALKHLASCMNQVVGAHGFVARLGGEEFAIRLPKISRAEAVLLMAALGTKLRSEGIDYGSMRIVPTVSIGLVREDGLRPVASLMRIADGCLYLAKEAGRDRFIFEDALDQKVIVAA